MIHPVLVNVLILVYKYGQELRYHPFAVSLDRCRGGFNIFNDLSNRLCVPDKTEDVNMNIFNMITGINELKTLIKHI